MTETKQTPVLPTTPEDYTPITEFNIDGKTYKVEEFSEQVKALVRMYDDWRKEYIQLNEQLQSVNLELVKTQYAIQVLHVQLQQLVTKEIEEKNKEDSKETKETE